MFTQFINWWNTPTENLMTKGHNIINVCGTVLPIGAVLILVIFKLFGVVGFSWWYVVSPLLLMVVAPLLMKLSPTGRQVIEQGFNPDEEQVATK